MAFMTTRHWPTSKIRPAAWASAANTVQPETAPSTLVSFYLAACQPAMPCHFCTSSFVDLAMHLCRPQRLLLEALLGPLALTPFECGAQRATFSLSRPVLHRELHPQTSHKQALHAEWNQSSA